MSETRTRARALLANVMCGPWRVATITEDGNPEPKQILVIDADRDQIASVEVRSDAELFAAAPTLIATLCDEADAAEDLYRSIKVRLGQTPGDGQLPHAAIDALERRAVEAEKDHSDALEWAKTMVEPTWRVAFSHSSWLVGVDSVNDLPEAISAILAERDALRAERAALRAVVCIDCGGTGGKRPNVGSTILYPPGTHCDKCGGSGAVIVKGDT